MKSWLFWLTTSLLVILTITQVRQWQTNTGDSLPQPLVERLLPATPTPTPHPTPTPLPTTKQLTGGTHTFQTFNNCGPAALSMALSHYDITASQQQLSQKLRPYQNPQGDNDDKSVTLQELATLADEYNLIAYHRPAGDAQRIKQLLALDLPVITRTWLKPNEDIGHFRVITGYDDTTQEFTQDDSLQGADLRYSYTDFDELWAPFNYEFLVLVPADKQTPVEQILGELLDEQTAWEKSLILATERSHQSPEDVYAPFNAAVAHYHLGNYSEAITRYESVASRLPTRLLWYQLEPILAYYQVGDLNQVLEITNRILNNQNRAYSELWYIQGKIYEKSGDQITADQAFAQANFFNTTGSWKTNLQTLGEIN